MQEEFGDASQERRTEIRGEFATLVEQIQKLIVPLKDAALLAYKEKPNASEKVVEVLLSAAMSKISEDEYSDAEEILQLLITNECPAMGVNDLAGITAFSQNRFDDAQTYLEKAKEEDALSSDGNRALQSRSQQPRKNMPENWHFKNRPRTPRSLKYDFRPRKVTCLLSCSKTKLPTRLRISFHWSNRNTMTD